MQHFPLETIAQWDRFYRANFINSLTGIKPVSLIGTIDAHCQPNLGTFSSLVHLGSNPALIGYINRPLAAAPHTLHNIEQTGAYTINHVHADFLPQAHQCSAKYPADVNEFEAVGLTAEYHDGIAAPFVAESRIKYALKLVEIVPITHNDTFLVIGAITDVFLPQAMILADGLIDVAAAASLGCNGADAYYTVAPLARYRYATPDTKPGLL